MSTGITKSRDASPWRVLPAPEEAPSPPQTLSPPLKEELPMHSLGEDPSLKREGGAEAGMSSGSRRGPWNQEAETWAYRLV